MGLAEASPSVTGARTALMEERWEEGLEKTVYPESPYASGSELPATIEIETSYQAFNDYYYFALVDGRVWYKPRFKRPVGKPEWVTDYAWKPFGLNGGLPYRLAGKKPEERDTTYADGERRGFVADLAFVDASEQDAETLIPPEDWATASTWQEEGDPVFVEDFKAPTRVLAITADADELSVLGDTRQMYYRRRFANLFVSTQWYQGWGQSKSLPVHFPDHITDHRGWSLGRITAAGAGYKEGPDGRIFEWGPAAVTMETMAWLSADGSVVYYLDSGTPPEIEHYVEAPFRGRYRGEALDASASTVMLIDRFGAVQTKIADFDLLGSTPTHPYCYFEECDGEVYYPPGDIRSGMSAIRLPAEGWAVHAPILPPEGWEAGNRIAPRIGIHQTGKGNASRELRVVGTLEGEVGYYFKGITEETWDFRAAPAGDKGFEALSEADFLRLEDLLQYTESTEVSGLHVDRPDPDRELVGRMKLKGDTEYGVSITGFNPRASPWQLEIAVGDTTLPMELHLVQAWNPYMKPHAAHHDKELATYEGTLGYDRSALELALGADATSETGQELRRFLDDAKNQKFVFLVNATGEGVEIRPKARRRVGPFHLVATLPELALVEGSDVETWSGYFWSLQAHHMGWQEEVQALAERRPEVSCESASWAAEVLELEERIDSQVDALQAVARKSSKFARRIFITSGVFYTLQIKTVEAALDHTREWRSDDVRPNELRFNVIAGVTRRVPYLARNVARVTRSRLDWAKAEQKEVGDELGLLVKQAQAVEKACGG